MAGRRSWGMFVTWDSTREMSQGTWRCFQHPVWPWTSRSSSLVDKMEESSVLTLQGCRVESS